MSDDLINALRLAWSYLSSIRLPGGRVIEATPAPTPAPTEAPKPAAPPRPSLSSQHSMWGMPDVGARPVLTPDQISQFQRVTYRELGDALVQNVLYTISGTGVDTRGWIRIERDIRNDEYVVSFAQGDPINVSCSVLEESPFAPPRELARSGRSLAPIAYTATQMFERQLTARRAFGDELVNRLIDRAAELMGRRRDDWIDIGRDIRRRAYVIEFVDGTQYCVVPEAMGVPFYDELAAARMSVPPPVIISREEFDNLVRQGVFPPLAGEKPPPAAPAPQLQSIAKTSMLWRRQLTKPVVDESQNSAQPQPRRRATMSAKVPKTPE